MISERLKTFLGKVKKGLGERLSEVKPEDIAKFGAKEFAGVIPVVGPFLKDVIDEFSPDEKGELIKELKDLSESQFKEISEEVGVSVEYLEDIQKFSLYTFKELRADHEEIKKLLLHLIETVETPVNVIGGDGITAGGDVYIINTGELAIGDFIKQSKNGKLSGEALVKLIDVLDRKRLESPNVEILNCYTPSALPDYPPRLRAFVTENRVEELTQALIYLQDHRILLTSGVGGVGKTTLARALIETRPANVPLPFWFDSSMNMDAKLGDILEKLASYMNTPDIAKFKEDGKEAGQDDINRLTGELQKREPVWLVFDNLETILDSRHFHDKGIDSLFTSLRDSTHQAKVIVTSRTLPLLGNGESLIDIIEEEKEELKGLKINFAVDYLTKNGLDSVEREKLEELANGVDGHPLALRLLIELVKKFGVSDTLKDLSMYQRCKEDTIKKARRLFDKLAGDEKELLERISVYRRPESMTAIKEMFTDKTSVDAVEKLIDKSLLETDHKGSYWLHPLVREFAYDDLENKIEAHKVAYQYYLSVPFPEKRRKNEDVQSLIEAHYHSCMAEEYDKAAEIIFDYKLDEDLNRWGNYRTLVELYQRILPKDPFRDDPLLSNMQIHSSVLGNLGRAYHALGRVKEAIEYYEKALKIAQDMGDRQNEGRWFGNLGRAYHDLGEVKEAIEYYEKALKIAQDIGDRQNEGRWLGELGIAYCDLGDVRKAIEFYEAALKIAQEIGDRRGEGSWFGSIGIAYCDLGDVRKAIEFYEDALKITQEIGDKRNEGRWLGNLGIAYRDLGDVRKAIEFYEDALKIAQEIGDRQGEGADLGNLGNAYYSLGQVERAIEYYEQAFTISRDIGDRRNEGTWLGNLGLAYSSLGQVKRAIGYYEQALAIARKVEDREGEGADLGSLGNAYYSLGQVERAIEYFKQALTISRWIVDRQREGTWLNNLGVAFKDLEKYDLALACYLLARKIRREIKDPEIETTENNISRLKTKIGTEKFQTLMDMVEPKAEEIIQGIFSLAN